MPEMPDEKTTPEKNNEDTEKLTQSISFTPNEILILNSVMRASRWSADEWEGGVGALIAKLGEIQKSIQGKQ